MTRLTAEQLQVTQAEYDALLWVRDALDPTISDHDLPEWMQFDMAHWGSIEPEVPFAAPRAASVARWRCIWLA